MRVNYGQNATPQFRMLSESQCAEIYYSALQILKRTGIEVFAAEIREFLKENGVLIQGGRACFPAAAGMRPMP